MPQIFREHELDEIVRVSNGTGPDTIVVTGPAGSGRTTLLITAAEETCVPTSIIRANPIERDWQYSGLSAFLAAVDDALGTTLRSLIPLPAGDRSAFEVAEDLDISLRRKAISPATVIIDDADLLDPASLEVISYLLRRKSVKGLRTILSVQSVSDSGPLASFARVGLGPVRVESLVELGRSLTSPLAWKSVLEATARSSAGNPKSFESMLSTIRPGALYENDALQLPLRPGKTLRETLGSSLDRCSEEMLEALKVLSCGSSIPDHIVEQVADSATDSVEELQREGLVRQLRHGTTIVDPRIRSLIYYSMPETDRQRLHTAIAATLTDDTLRTWHSSFVAIDDTTAADLLGHAAGLFRDGRILCGMEFAERALFLAESPIPELTVETMVRELLIQCQYTLARRYLRVLQGKNGSDDVSPEVLRLRILIDFTELSLVNDQHVTKVVDRSAESAPDSCARLLASIGFCYILQWDTENAWRSVDRMSVLLGADAETVREFAVMVTLFDKAIRGQALPDVEELEAICDRARQCFPVEFVWILIAQALTLADRFDDARAVLSNFSDQASHLSPIWAKFSRIASFVNEKRAGNYHRVRELDELLTAGNDHYESVSVNDQIRAATMAVLDGQSDIALRAVHTARRLTAHGSSRVLRSQLAVVEGHTAMQKGDFTAASRHFARSHRLSSSLPSPHLLRYLDDYIESLVYSGQTAQAKKIFDELDRAAKEVPMMWTASAAARSRALLMSGDESAQEFSRLLDSWTSPELEYLRGRTFLAYAHKLKELGYDADAEEKKAIGHSALTEIGFGVPCTRDETHTDSTSSILDSLTEKETAVVELVAQGYKNHLIARELFVSVRTVELRLTNIYRKVGIKSRFELMRLLDRERSTSAGAD